MSVCLDLVLNHTAKEHDWAVRARQGETSATRTTTGCSTTARCPTPMTGRCVEIFPAHAPGNFTWYPDMRKWVWTTFNEHQWDLNWSNPRVFLEIVKVMLFLANQGVEVAAARCRGLHVEAHGHALPERARGAPDPAGACAPRAASWRRPSSTRRRRSSRRRTSFPISAQGRHTGKEGNLAYHNSLMVQFWSALATRETTLMTHVLRTHFPESFVNATWGTYLRCHDDIGWAVTDEDAAAVGISGPRPPRFPRRLLCRAAFRAASRAAATSSPTPAPATAAPTAPAPRSAASRRRSESGDAAAIDAAIHRILMGHALIASFGGIPLIYMGDELGLLNDHAYRGRSAPEA